MNLPKNAWLLLVAVIALLCVARPGLAEEDPLVRAIMNDRYPGATSAAHQCWIVAEPKYGPYCVKPAKWQWIESTSGRRLYLLTSGIPMNRDGSIDELPPHAYPGLVGAYLVEAGVDKPSYLAATDALLLGSFGDAGARAARLVQIGPSGYYAWIFVSGGTWQGVSVGHYNVLAPHGRIFEDLSEIPQMREEDQEHRFDIAFDTSSSYGPAYPMIVTRRVIAARSAEARIEDRRVVRFDPKTWRYRLPPER